MLSVDDFIGKSGNRAKVVGAFRGTADIDLTTKLTVCIPDVHLLERGINDKFFGGQPENVDRFLDFLDFMDKLRESCGDDLDIIQIGDLYDLWKAKGNSNLIDEAYTDILGLIDKVRTTYLVGNHDFEMARSYKSKGETFRRIESYCSSVDGKPRAVYQHGWQADIFNNQERWTGGIGKNVTKIVGLAEYLYPDIDVVLGRDWESVTGFFERYSAIWSPSQNPDGFSADEYLRYYIDLMEKRNSDGTADHPEPLDLVLAVVGHTHHARLVPVPRNGRTYYLLDCGSWVDGGHEIGVISGRDMAVCEWD